MKKKIFLACLVAVVSTVSAYSYTYIGNCDGGIIIESTTGARFCMSNKIMNWWSAQAWCYANVSRLVTMYEMCPSWDGNTGTGKCPELENVTGSYKWLWSATASGVDSVFSVRGLDGSVVDYIARSLTAGYNGNVEMYAFCR